MVRENARQDRWSIYVKQSPSLIVVLARGHKRRLRLHRHLNHVNIVLTPTQRNPQTVPILSIQNVIGEGSANSMAAVIN